MVYGDEVIYAVMGRGLDCKIEIIFKLKSIPNTQNGVLCFLSWRTLRRRIRCLHCKTDKTYESGGPGEICKNGGWYMYSISDSNYYICIIYT